MNQERQWIFAHTMEVLDGRYDSGAALVSGPEGKTDVRDSVHYALGLLERAGEGDGARAQRVLAAVLDAQFDAYTDDPYYGTFKRTDEEETPPHAAFPGVHFDAWARYDLDVWQEKIANDLRASLLADGFTQEQNARIAGAIKRAILRSVPIIWESYDPNWREFICTTLSLVLARHADKLPQALLERMAQAAERAVCGSIERYNRGIHPMNTNVELMHIYVCDFYGAYLQRPDFTAHAQRALAAFRADYDEYGTVAEFNSPTYYCVNFATLSAWRQYAPSAALRSFGARMEAALWREVSERYHPALGAVCGPYSRSYELDIRLHTSFPVLFYMALGAENAPVPADNCELAGNVDFAVLGTQMPEDARGKLLHFGGEHSVTSCFKELIERGAPDANRPVCTATSYLAEDYMLGALSGSRNTSGQLRPALATWRAPDGQTAYMAMRRRAAGEQEGGHCRTVFWNAKVEKNRMTVEVCAEINRDMEIYFEIDCPGAQEEQLAADCFDLPGMRVQVKAEAPEMEIRHRGRVLEAVYLSRAEDESRRMRFELTFEKR